MGIKTIISKLKYFTSTDKNVILKTKKPDILLVSPPPFDIMMPPHGVACLATFLKDNGKKADVIDLNIKMYNLYPEKNKLWDFENSEYWYLNFDDILKTYGSYLDSLIEKILASKYKFICFSVTQFSVKIAYHLSDKIRKRDSDAVIIWGGPACSGKPSVSTNLPVFIESKLDVRPGVINAFVVGDGETTLLELIKKHKEGSDAFIPGSIELTDTNPKRYSDLLPVVEKNIHECHSFPKYDEFDIKEYKTRSLPVILNKGCFLKCAYCNNPSLKQKFTIRPAKEVFEEIRYNYFHNKIRSFCFSDLLLNGDPKIFEELCNLIILSKINVGLAGQMAIRPTISQEIFEKAKKAGFNEMTFGIESGSSDILKKMKKTYMPKEARHTLERSKKAGIITKINIIIGFPGETEKDFQDTLKFVDDNIGSIDRISSLNICYILPKSDIEINPKDYGIDISMQDYWIRWKSKDKKNTLPVRRRRMKLMQELLKKRDIPIDYIGPLHA